MYKNWNSVIIGKYLGEKQDYARLGKICKKNWYFGNNKQDFVRKNKILLE